VSVLLVTPSVGFGELIHQTLVDTDSYDVVFVTTGEEAMVRAHQREFALAILDTDLTDGSFSEIWPALKSQNPEMKLLLIPPESGLDESMAVDLSPDGWLNKPFYLPDLLTTVREVMGEDSPSDLEAVHGREGSSQPPPWLQDVDRAARHLTQLSLETAAQAALITRQDQIWAYAGELPQPAANELAEAVADYWARDEGSDFVRFIRVEATGGEYMLYATTLAGDMVLSLAFEARTPFSQIRKQAVRLAHALATTPNGEIASQTMRMESFGEPPSTSTPVESIMGDVPPPTPAGTRPERAGEARKGPITGAPQQATLTMSSESGAEDEEAEKEPESEGETAPDPGVTSRSVQDAPLAVEPVPWEPE
jgi:DNA-binding response OmpR family regulator